MPNTLIRTLIRAIAGRIVDGPLSAPSAASFDVIENSTAVGRIPASGGEGTRMYALSGPDAALFNLDTGSGVITFVSAPDYETDPIAYSITGSVSDDVDGPLNVAITVNVLDIANESPPAFSSPNAVSVAEGETTVMTVIAVDPDPGSSAPSYSITGGADQALFTLNPSTGALAFIIAGVVGSYVIEVSATTDGDTVAQTIAVTVTDESGPGTAVIPDSAVGGSAVLVPSPISAISTFDFDFSDNRAPTSNIVQVALTPSIIASGGDGWTRSTGSGFVYLEKTLMTGASGTVDHQIVVSLFEASGSTVVAIDSFHNNQSNIYGNIESGSIDHSTTDPSPSIGFWTQTGAQLTKVEGTITDISVTDILGGKAWFIDPRFADRQLWETFGVPSADTNGWTHSTYNDGANDWDNLNQDLELIAATPNWSWDIRTRDNGSDVDWEFSAVHGGIRDTAGYTSNSGIMFVYSTGGGAAAGDFGDDFGNDFS